jgi:hypothetical protein
VQTMDKEDAKLQSAQPPSTDEFGREPESLKQPAWHVFTIGALTMGAYCWYWFYKNWRDLKNQAAKTAVPDCPIPEGDASPDAVLVFKDINPLLRLFGLLVPILNVYLYLTQILGIATLHPNPDSVPRKNPLLAAGIIVGSMFALLACAKLPGPLFLIYVLAPAPLAVVQHWLNEYWDTVEPPGLLFRHAFTWKEMLAIILGSSLLGLIVAGFMIGPSAGVR